VALPPYTLSDNTQRKFSRLTVPCIKIMNHDEIITSGCTLFITPQIVKRQTFSNIAIGDIPSVKLFLRNFKQYVEFDEKIGFNNPLILSFHTWPQESSVINAGHGGDANFPAGTPLITIHTASLQ
jgi:hypothetical protein